MEAYGGDVGQRGCSRMWIGAEQPASAGTAQSLQGSRVDEYSGLTGLRPPQKSWERSVVPGNGECPARDRLTRFGAPTPRRGERAAKPLD